MDNYIKVVELWKRKNIKTSAELAEALNGHSITFAYNSGNLENQNVTYHDTKEIFEHDEVSSYTGDLRTLFEIHNAKIANEVFLDAFEEKRPLDESLIKEFQYALTQNTYSKRRWELGERPGKYKKNDFVTGKNDIGASAEDVEEEISELLEDLKDADEKNALTAAAFFHVKFENIHPFADGNGRTGRLLMNYILVMFNHPPVVIHQEDRNEYYYALEAWDEVQDLKPMTEFLKAQIVKTWQRMLDKEEKRNK